MKRRRKTEQEKAKKPREKQEKIPIVEGYALNDTDMRVLKHSLTPPTDGLTARELGELLNLSQKQIENIRRKPAYLHAKKAYMRKAWQIFEDNREKAAKTVLWLLDHAKTDSVRLRAAEMILGDAIKANQPGQTEDNDLAAVAHELSTMNDPRAFPALLARLGELAIVGKIPESLVKTIAYLHQNWQSAFSVGQGYEEIVTKRRDEVFIARIIDGQVTRSRMDELREFPELWGPDDHATKQ